MGEKISLTASDGHQLDAYKAEPSGASKGGLVVIQEIFGVNDDIRETVDLTDDASSNQAVNDEAEAGRDA